MNSGKHQRFNMKLGQAKMSALEPGLKHRATAIYERITDLGSQDSLIEVEWSTDRRPLVQCDETSVQSQDMTSAWPTAVRPSKFLTPRRGHSVTGVHPRSPVMLVAVLGRDADQIESTVRKIEQQQQQTQNFFPLFLTNNACQSAFRQAGYNFEYFPSDQYCGDTQTVRFQQKFFNIWKKWSAETLVDLSAPGFLKDRLDDLDKYCQPEPVSQNSYNVRRKRPAVRMPPPTDVAALKAEYLTKGLDKDTDTFVLYRILGNDLPPRHKAGQTLDNLRFMLDHEPQFENCEKRWVVNRIVNPDQENPILQMLEQHDQPYLRIPFELDEYRLCDWDFETFPRPDFFLNGPYAEITEYDQQRAEAHVRRHKNRYAINNNGARNAALRDGRDRAKWVLPWDGNCFLTAGAWDEIVEGVKSAPYLKYFTVPMARTLDNTDLLQDGYHPEAADEPQILFRKDATEEFDEQFPYGRRPKVELFLRLGIAGRWDRWDDDKWDLRRPKLAEEAGTCGSTGWVSRLFSGQEELEGAKTSDLRSRGVARITAVNSMLDVLDQNAAKTDFDPSNLTAYDEDKILALKSAPAGSPKGKVLSRLLQEADLALQRGPYSVVDKLSLPPSGDKHDYFNPAPYYWPNPNTPNGLPLVLRDGERIPGTGLYDLESDNFDRTRLQRLFDDTTVLALAWKATGELKYAEHAAQHVRHWFISEDSQMNPHLQYAQANPMDESEGAGKSGLIEMKDLYFLLDAVRLLEQSGCFGEADRTSLNGWLTSYLDWLLTSDQGIAERKSLNNHGTCFDLQTGSIAAYLGDQTLLHATFRTSRERLMTHFELDGTQPHEMTRTQTAHYCCFNLQSWVNLANLATRCGDSLWQFEGSEGQGMAAGFNWLLPYLAKSDWPFKQIERFDQDRFLPLFFAARELCGNFADRDGAKPEQVKPLFFPHDGIKPFWMLGQTTVPSMETETCQMLSKTVAKTESPVIDSIVSMGAFTETQPDVSILDQKLWGGFSQSARLELEAIQQDSGSAQVEINRSARALARWHFTARDYKRTLDSIETMRGLDTVSERERGLVKAYCLDQLGQPDDALTILRQSLIIFPDNSNLCLSMANFQGGFCAGGKGRRDESGLDWVNKIYSEAGLTPLSFDASAKSVGPASLTVGHAGKPSHGNWDDPLVSVIVTVGPQHDGFDITVPNLLGQTWRNLEILIVDYSCNKDLKQVISALAETDSRVKIVPADLLRLNYEALNLGLRHALGCYVTTFCADEFAHPEKIAKQLHELQRPGCQAVLTCQALLSKDMRFIAGWHPEFSFIPVQTSSLMLSTDTLKELGGWDAVETDPDPFLLWRLKKTVGSASVHVACNRVPLSISIAAPSRQLPTHLSFPYGRQRDLHKKAVRMMQRQVEQDESIDLVGEPCERVLAPPKMQSEVHSTFDMVFTGDFADGSIGLSVLMGQLAQMDLEGRTIGIFNWPDYRSPWKITLGEDLAELLEADLVMQISAGEKTTAKVLVLCNPYVVRYPVDGLPEFMPERVEVLCGSQIATAEIFDGLRRIMPTASEIEDAFHAPCEWVAI